MRTSLISYRVADFLKQHPPFQSVRIDELLPLAQSGRVTFHSEDEIVCTQGQPCKPWFWVIQQGSVELIEEPAGAIRDLLTVGDIFGADRFAGRENYTYSARTTCDVILYALDLETFAQLRARWLTVDRYVRALLSVQTVPASAGQGEVTAHPAWLPVSALTEAILKAHLVCRSKETSIGEVAAAMLASNCHVAAVTNAAGFPLGIVTDVVLRAALAEGMTAAMAVGEIMQTRFPVAPLGLSLEESILMMLRERESFVVVTNDGSSATPVEGVITETTVQLLSGVSPSLFVRRTKEAESMKELAVLGERVYAFVQQHLNEAGAVGWFSEFLTSFLHTLTVRILELCQTQLEREGFRSPSARWCWVFFGAAGRGELLTPVVPTGALVFDDSCSAEDASWFERLGTRLLEGYAACNLASCNSPVPLPAIAQSAGAWKATFRKLLEDPLFARIHHWRALFDFQAAAGDSSLAEEIRTDIRHLLTDAPAAIALLGNDCLESFPPLTLFQDLVVEVDGSRRSALNLSTTALEPLADVGRVFALAAGDPVPSGTINRLMQAADHFPEHAALILEAAEAVRVLLLEQCRTGIRERSDGCLLYPALLSRYEQLLLKSAFRSVVRVMEFTYANAFSLKV